VVLPAAVVSAAVKLYVWEGHGISGPVGDGGTLVVLADSPEEARGVVRQARVRRETRVQQLGEAIRRHRANRDREALKVAVPEFVRLLNERVWDGTDESLEREPDRVLDTLEPGIVAFNGDRHV
jgi:hypothetical protein